MNHRSDLKILERVFEYETQGRLFQRDSKQIRRLVEDGYLEPFKFEDGRGWLRMTVSGYRLTHKGRITYCDTCQ